MYDSITCTDCFNNFLQESIRKFHYFTQEEEASYSGRKMNHHGVYVPTNHPLFFEKVAKREPGNGQKSKK
jgi:hypothetical protein